jgi:Zn-dependent protease with chaperone function
VTVLASDEPAGYSWRDGEIFVTRGLADRLTDPELAAAIAHELGHLLSDGEVRAVCSLSGMGASLDVEARADSLGTDLLRSCAIPPERMMDMLNKVAGSGSISPDTRLAIAHRVQLLQSRLKPE